MCGQMTQPPPPLGWRQQTKHSHLSSHLSQFKTIPVEGYLSLDTAQSRHDGDDLSPGTSHPLLLIMERLHSHSQIKDNVSLLDSKEGCKVN